MGSDGAPRPEVEGALAAAADAALDVLLVGDEAQVRAILSRHGGTAGAGLRVEHAPEAIAMDDAPVMAVKHKKRSSMRRCFELAKAGEVDAVVSAGNSGAMMACGLFVWGRLPGVDRPAIVTTFPTRTGVCALLDMGANVDTKPTVLAQFAILGAVYARLRHRKERPRVGLLSNGSEEHKGTTLTRETHRLLSAAKGDGASFDYRGYIEGRDIFRGEIDVVVTDGFTGNVILKSCEGLMDVAAAMVREEIARGGPLEKLGAALMKPALRRFRRRTDYAETGGALLLGVDGVALICHGGSDAYAIKNAVGEARAFVGVDFGAALTAAIAEHAFLWRDEPRTPAPAGGGQGGKDRPS